MFGVEQLGQNEVRWRIRFTKEPIASEELRGIAVFCGVKLAQAPFYFGLSGGLSGQHGQQYIVGSINADFLDRLDTDLITTERQRINWQHEDAEQLLKWGQERIKSLLRLWKARRAESRVRQINTKMYRYSDRLDQLPTHERRVIKRALSKITTIETLSDNQFGELSDGVLTAWEGGRLMELINDIGDVSTMDEAALLRLLVETQVLNALHVAEAVKAKLGVIEGLRERIKQRDLENAVRNFIAENPWLLSPEWDTFKKEISLNRLLNEIAGKAGLNKDKSWRKRVDLVMAAGRQLLIVEFMRPGLKVNRDHLNRYGQYVDMIREAIQAETESVYDAVSGLLVADSIGSDGAIVRELKRLAKDGMQTTTWDGLLGRAEKQWEEFLDILVARSPDDKRLRGLGRNDDLLVTAQTAETVGNE